MKSWFEKFRTSLALNAEQPLEQKRDQRKRHRAPGQFPLLAAQFDEALKQQAVRPSPPNSLHSSIMRALQEAEPAPGLPRPRFIPVRLAAPAFAALVLVSCAAWFLFQRAPAAAPAPFSLSAPVSALDDTQKIAETLPANVLAPLSVEWRSVNRDVDQTTQFLLASLP